MLPKALTWVDVEFVKNVLRSSENDDSIEVKNLGMKLATATGDNYLSDIIRASVEYSHEKSGRKVIEEKSLIIKVAPTEEGATKQMVLELGAFEMEIEMMKTTLTKMNELLKGSRLSARVLHAEIGEPSFIVMEDLAPLGYRMADRQFGLDLEHCILTMRGLAEFHASSIAFYEEDPEAMSTYKNDAFQNVVPATIKKLFVKELKTFANALLSWSELGSSARSYSEKFFKIANLYHEEGLRYHTPRKGDVFNVLNHGDCWINNILFQYNDEGKVIDYIFVDFQMCAWTSPVLDIITFLNTSLSDDVDSQHHELLLEKYLNTLTKTMLQLGCNTKPPNMTAFKETLKKNQVLEIIPSTAVMGTILIDKRDAKSINETMKQSDDYINPVYKMPSFRKRLLRRLFTWNASGILDV